MWQNNIKDIDLLLITLQALIPTLQYDDKLDSISVIRLKENAEDYRYFPCPDLPPVLIKNEKF